MNKLINLSSKITKCFKTKLTTFQSINKFESIGSFSCFWATPLPMITDEPDVERGFLGWKKEKTSSEDQYGEQSFFMLVASFNGLYYSIHLTMFFQW